MALFQAASSTAFSVIPIATAHISLAGNFIDAVANPLRLFRLREDAVESGFQGSRDGPCFGASALDSRSEEHTSELQSRLHLVCRLLLEKKKQTVRPFFPDFHARSALYRKHSTVVAC